MRIWIQGFFYEIWFLNSQLMMMMTMMWKMMKNDLFYVVSYWLRFSNVSMSWSITLNMINIINLIWLPLSIIERMIGWNQCLHRTKDITNTVQKREIIGFQSLNNFRIGKIFDNLRTICQQKKNDRENLRLFQTFCTILHKFLSLVIPASSFFVVCSSLG